MWGYYASPGGRNLRRGCGPLRSKACELVPRRRHALGRRHRQPQPQPALDHSPPGHRWWPSRFRATSAASNRSDGTRFTRLTSTPGGDGDPDWSPNGTGIAFVTSRFTPEQETSRRWLPTARTSLGSVGSVRAGRCGARGWDEIATTNQSYEGRDDAGLLAVTSETRKRRESLVKMAQVASA